MEPNQLFEQLKKIKPDPDYSRLSLARIMQHPQLPRTSPAGLWRFAAAGFRFASAAALTGLVILVAAGSASFVFKTLLSPLDNLVSLNPEQIRAEASDIDAMQIQLETLKYEETSRPAGPSVSAIKKISQLHQQNEQEESDIATLSEEASTSSEATSDESAIDEALEALSLPQ